ncbi:MAG: N-acetyltransferase family protein [Acidobacteriota bacterium]
MSYIIDSMKPEDWPQVRTIYQDGIATGHATFETTAPDWQQWDAGHLTDCRLVARNSQKILGWAALSAVSRRQVYSGVAEVSVYVAADARGQGIGDRLMAELIAASEPCGIWTLQSSIFPENQASVTLHLKYGFREVGRRERIAKLQGRWRDTVLLERRCPTTGID